MTDLTPFVPALAGELGATPGSHWTSVEGSMLSADISGFTALSERLAGKGKAGAEEITELINTCFTALIDAAYEFGGEVLKFGGDALLILFRGDHHERRCANAGQAMQRALHASSAAKRANLTMTVGAAEGPFDVFLAGSGYKELLITGPRASTVIHLEGEAEKGETLVSPAIAEALPPDMIGREHAGGLAVSGQTGDRPTGPRQRSIGDLDLTPFVPPSVREQLVAFEGMGGEHRLVSVGFVMIGGVAAEIERSGPDGTAVAFGQLVDDLMEATAPYGVTILHTDIAPDGVKFVLCAGAPVNPGDTSDALLRAALEIAAIEAPFVIRQGVQTGRVFAGFLGSPHRRTYTLMGDPVNTAARMLGKADDRDVVAVGSVVDDTRTIFVTEELEPFLVKGKTEPIVAHKVLAGSDEARRGASATRLFGRRSELDILAGAIGELGDIVVLTGAAGVGKSRLLDAAWDAAEGLRVYQGACTPYGAASPYSVFRPLLRTGSSIDVNADARTAGEQLTQRVRDVAPELLPMLPLLAVPFGAEVAATPETRSIEPELRRARIHDTVLDFLDASLAGPVFLVIEDLHWVDDASGELVNHLVRAAASRPWTGVFTRRPRGDWAIPDDTENVTEIELGPLTVEDIRELAIEVSTRALSDKELEVVVERSDGNPLFAIELARAVGGGSTDGLPDSIEGLISTRIDGLRPQARRVVRLASVFGREFDPGDVTALTDDAGESLDPAALDGLVEALDGHRYAFTHAMYRDVAYEGLPFRERRHLHGRVAEYLEATAADAEEIAPLLSLHFSEGRRWPEAWRYSRTAGEQAASQYAHAEAVLAYQRAVDAARKLRSVDPDERRVVTQELGDSLLVIGRYDEAFDAYGKARRDADHLTDTDLMRRQGMVRDRQGAVEAAVRWYERCLRRLPDSQLSSAEREVRLHVALAYAAVRHRQGKFPECLEWAKRAEADAVELGDTASQAKALDRLHVAATYLGLPEAERYGPAALALHRELDDHLSQARILDNMGIQAYFAYDWDTAVDLYGQAADAGRIAGDVIEANLARMNAAEVASDRGHFETAAAEFRDVLRNWRAAGWKFGIAAAGSNLGLALARSGNADDGLALLSDALEQFERIGADEFIAETTIRLAEASAQAGSFGQARDHAEAALAIIDDAQNRSRILRHLATCAAADGNRTEAVTQLRESIELAREAGAKYEEGLSCLVLAAMSPADRAEAGRGSALLAELGVVDLAPKLLSLGVEPPARPSS